jgi:hypothetical protein
MSDLFVDNIKHQSSQGSGTITLGASGETIALASGASQNFANNTPAFFVYKTGSTQSISSGTITKVTFNTELYDTDNNFDNSTNYRFTPTTAGKYFFSASIYVAGSSQRYLNVYIRKNGSTNFGSYSAEDTENNLGSAGVVANVTYDMNGSSDYVEVFAQSSVTSGNIQYDNNGFTTYFQGYKLIGA